MTSDDMRSLRRRLGLTQAGLAAALGLSAGTIADYESSLGRRADARPIPRVVELACAAVEAQLRP